MSGVYDDRPLQTYLTPIGFLKQPRVILKLGVMIVSVIGLGCATNGYYEQDYYIFNNDFHACRFAIAINLLGFLFATISVVTDYMFDKISNIKHLRHILISDVAGAGLFGLLNFVAFCYLTNRWSNTHSAWLEERGFEHWQQRNARSVIFFAFIAILVWGGLTLMALLRLRASGKSMLSDGFPHSAMDTGLENSAGIDDMYPPQPKAAMGPTPPQQQQPIGGGGGVGSITSTSYYPPPTF